MFHKVILMTHKKIIPKYNHFKKILKFGLGVKKSFLNKQEHKLNSNFQKLTIRPNLFNHEKNNKLIISGSSIKHNEEPKTKIIDGVRIKLNPDKRRPIRLML